MVFREKTMNLQITGNNKKISEQPTEFKAETAKTPKFDYSRLLINLNNLKDKK